MRGTWTLTSTLLGCYDCICSVFELIDRIYLGNMQPEESPQPTPQQPIQHTQSTEPKQVTKQAKVVQAPVEENIEENKPKVQLHNMGEAPLDVDKEQPEINFISCRVGKMGGLEGCSNLKILMLRNNLIQKIEGLEDCINLENLELYDNRITAIEGVKHLKNLKILDLSFNNIKVIEGLEELQDLQSLFLLNNKIKRIQNLNFAKLEMLELGANKIENIENLDKLPNLNALYLGKNRISEVKNLEHLPKLESITLGPNRLETIGKGLDCLKDTLTGLFMQENKITSLEDLSQLSKLTILDVSYNKVSSLKGIESFKRLETLYLNSNQLQQYEDIELLTNNPQLTTISLGGNSVSKVPGYRQKLIQMLPKIDDIDGIPEKTNYNIVFNT